MAAVGLVAGTLFIAGDGLMCSVRASSTCAGQAALATDRP